MPTSLYYPIAADDCTDIVSAIKEKGALIADELPGKEFASAVRSLKPESSPYINAVINKQISEICFDMSEITELKGLYGFKSVTKIDMPHVSRMTSCYFEGNTVLSQVSMPRLEEMNANAFRNCTALSSVNLSGLTGVAMNAFNGCNNLTSVNFPNIDYIDANAFTNCQNLITFSGNPFGYVVYRSAFENCYVLSSVDFSNIRVLYSNTFRNVGSSLSSSQWAQNAVFTRLSYMTGGWQFYGARILEMEFPALESISGSTPFLAVLARKITLNSPYYTYCPEIERCSNLETLSLPYARRIGLIKGPNMISKLSFPALTNLYASTFVNMSLLTEITFDSVLEPLTGKVFSSCPNLSVANFIGPFQSYISTSARFNYLFNGTLIGSLSGTINVPASLLSDYAAMWPWASSMLSIYSEGD